MPRNRHRRLGDSARRGGLRRFSSLDSRRVESGSRQHFGHEAERGRERRRDGGESRGNHSRPDRRRGTREIVAAPRCRSLSQRAERHRVQSFLSRGIPRRIRADDRAHGDDRHGVVLHHEQPNSIRQRVGPNHRKLE